MSHNNVTSGSKNNVYTGSFNNVRNGILPATINDMPGLGFFASNDASGYTLPSTATPPTDGVFYTDIVPYTGALPGGISTSILYPAAPGGPGYPSGADIVWFSGSHIENPSLNYWEYSGQYTPSPPSSLIWSQGPTFLIISSTAVYPMRSLYRLFINLCAGICWPNGGCVQCYISLFGDGTHLFAVGPAFTPPFWQNYFLSQPADLAASFFFNPQTILGSSANFYLALKITGGPSSIASGSGSSQVAIAVLHN